MYGFGSFESEERFDQRVRAAGRMVERIYRKSGNDPDKEEIKKFLGHQEKHWGPQIWSLFSREFFFLLIKRHILGCTDDEDNFAHPVCLLCGEEFRIIEPMTDPTPHKTRERISDTTISCTCGLVHPIFSMGRDVFGIQFAVDGGFLLPVLPGMDGKVITSPTRYPRPWPRRRLTPPSQ